jgi:hypothetical protein
MPILNDIMDHGVLGPEIRKARAEGRQEGEHEIVLRLIEKRFGPLPAWAAIRLDDMDLAEIEKAALRLLDANSLEELLAR